MTLHVHKEKMGHTEPETFQQALHEVGALKNQVTLKEAHLSYYMGDFLAQVWWGQAISKPQHRTALVEIYSLPWC